MATSGEGPSQAITSFTAENSMYVLFYPVGSRGWNIRQRPDPDSSIVGTARHGRREAVTEVRLVSNVRWLALASGGWVRDRHPDFMEWRWPSNPAATGYYGWHPSDLVSDKIIQASEQNWTVPVPIQVGGWFSGFSYMSHPDTRWASLHMVLLALLLLGVLLVIRNFVFGAFRMLLG